MQYPNSLSIEALMNTAQSARECGTFKTDLRQTPVKSKVSLAYRSLSPDGLTVSSSRFAQLNRVPTKQIRIDVQTSPSATRV